jgi:hypothetical protein
MTSWIEPRVQWRTADELTEQPAKLLRDGEHVATWPAEPFEKTATDCYRLGDHFWIWQRGIGGVEFATATPALRAYREPGADPTWFEHVVTRSWMPAVYQVWGRQVLHASAVADDAGSVVAFTGPSGAGKSTFAFGLSRRSGWQQVADDTLAFASEDGALRLYPLPNSARLRPRTARYHRQEGKAPERLSWPSGRLTLTRIYAIGASDELTDAVDIAPLTATEAYRVLLEQAHAFTLAIPEHNQRLMLDYLQLAALPAFRLSYRRSFDHFEQVLDVVEAHCRA